MLVRGGWSLAALGVLALPPGCDVPASPAASSGDSSVIAPAPDAERSTGTLPDSAPGWPCLLGPDGDSVSREPNIATDWDPEGPAVKWRRSIGSGYSAPVVLANRLVLFYRQGDEEVLDCADAESGTTRWTFRYPTSYKCPVNYSSGPYSTPVLEVLPDIANREPGTSRGAEGTRSRVYAWGAEGRLHCLDLEGGTVCWSRALHEDYPVEPGLFPVAASPLLVGDRLIVQVGARSVGAGVIAIDKWTGRTLWTATHDVPSCATPVAATIHGRQYVFVWTAQHLTALDPAAGQVSWQIPFSANNPQTIHATSPIVSGDTVLVSGYQLGCLCVRVLQRGHYEELWRGGKDYLDSQYNNLLCRDGYVYGFGTVRGSLRCVELATGRLAWTWKSQLRRAASIGVADRLLLFDEQGRLASVRVSPAGCERVAMTARGLLAGRCFTAPALSRGLLYLRNEEELLCVDLRGEMSYP